MEIELVSGSSLDSGQLIALGALRNSVWQAIVRTGRTAESWLDDLDRQAVHFFARFDGSILAAARLTIHATADDIPDVASIKNCFPDWRETLPVASLNRLVVSPSVRGRGLGTKMDALRVTWARKQSARSVIGLAATWRVPQLNRLGLRAHCEIPGCIHGYDELPLVFMEHVFGAE